MPTSPTSSPPRTYRAIGIAVVSGGQAVDLALIETDGAAHIRHIETERQPLAAGSILAAVTLVTRVFMGDRALQPSAIDFIGLAADAGDLNAANLGASTDIATRVTPPELSARTGTRAERAAFAAVAVFAANATG